MRDNVTNFENFDPKISSNRYHRSIVNNSIILILSDSLVFSFSLIFGNYLLLLINGIEFSIVNGWLIVPAWVLFSFLNKLLPCWGVGIVDEIQKIQKTLFFMFALILITSFLSKIEFSSSRIVFVFSYLFSAIFIPVVRRLVRKYFSNNGSWGVPVAIYGSDKDILDCIKLLESDLALGYIPSSAFVSKNENISSIGKLDVLGTFDDIDVNSPIGIVLQGSLSNKEYLNIIDKAGSCYKRLIIIPEIISGASLWVTPIDFQGTLGLEITKNLLNPFSKKLKIVCDYFFVILLFPIWLLLILIIGLLIIFEDGKNPLFFQERIGEEGIIFNTIKFRTMVPDAESKLKLALENNKDLLDEWNKSYKLKKDPRITKVGKILRITSLDELPQLFNVLNGTMSVVGPRPLPIYHFQELPNYVQDLRNKVKPGITGLWQVSGRSEVGTSGMKKWDPYYVRNWSIWLDIVILFKTIKAVFSAKGAY